MRSSRFLTGPSDLPLVALRHDSLQGGRIARISGYVDLHAHLLPGIDDGPPDLEQSLEMAQAAAGSGVSTIAATPHLRGDFPDVVVGEIGARCDALREVLGRERIPLEVVSGAEVSLGWAIDADDEHLRLASYGQLGTDLLIETPFTQIVGFDRFLYTIRSKGYRVTLGHPERNPQFQRDDGPLRALAAQGVILQVNADSLAGSASGSRTRRLAQQLLIDGVADVIASDGHRGESWRPVTRLAQAVDAAAELVGAERAEWMARDAPAAITAGTELTTPPPLRIQPRRRRFFRFS